MDKDPNKGVDKKVLDKYFGFKCTNIKEEMLDCFKRCENKYIFKRKLLRYCDQIENKYINCVLSNNMSSASRVITSRQEKNEEYLKEKEEVMANFRVKNDYLEGRISEDFINTRLRRNHNLKEFEMDD
mmetsp:Transcript_33601/g.34892  ORF Transcript_33601/g.34892 Transcript_33601/m.34892 type:complete len:128 (+) Transcript_33601:18-401(+)